MRLPGRSGRYKGHQHDRGSSAVELAILGPALIILTLSIIVYALQVPTLIAFTVARWETAPSVEPDPCR